MPEKNEGIPEEAREFTAPDEATVDPQAERIRELYELTPEQLHETPLHDLPLEHVAALTKKEYADRYGPMSDEELKQEAGRIWDSHEQMQRIQPDLRNRANRKPGDKELQQAIRDAEYSEVRNTTRLDLITEIRRVRDRKRFMLDRETGKTPEK